MATDVDSFLSDYEKISVKMLGASSIQENMLKSINELFEDFQLGNETAGQVLSEVAVQTAIQYNKDAITSAMDLAKLVYEGDVKAAQQELFERQKQGYDDNMLLKIVEHQASLASFAVNAGSNTAQTTIDQLKVKMLAVENRVVKLDGENECPLPPRITPVPENLLVTNRTDESLSLQWSAIIDATSYLLYKDGVLIATQGALTFIDDGLEPVTKYSYAVKASIDGVVSDYSPSTVESTLEVI